MKINRRKFVGTAALAPLAFGIMGSDGGIEIDTSKWQDVGGCTFAMEIMPQDGFLPRLSDTVRIESPAMTATGKVTWVRTAPAQYDDVGKAHVLGSCTIKAHDFKGVLVPRDVKIFFNDVERSGQCVDLYITEAA